MKTAFTFKRWYWGDDYDKQPPQWWTNFSKNKTLYQIHDELSRIAKVRQKMNGDFRVVFNSSADLSFFIMRWS